MSDSSLLKNAQSTAPASKATDIDEAFLQDHPWVRHYEQGVFPRLAIPDRPLYGCLIPQPVVILVIPR